MIRLVAILLAICTSEAALLSSDALAITHDANSNNRGAAVSSLSTSHTAGGTNRFLLCGYAVVDVAPQPVTTATYNGIAMTRLGTELSPDAFSRTGAFYLVNSSSGTNSVVIGTAGGVNSRMFVACTSWDGVHQASPLVALATNAGLLHPGPITDDVFSAAGQLVVDIAVIYSSAVALSVGAGQTLRAENFNGANGDHIAISEEAGASTVTMSWSHGAATPTYSHFAVSLRPDSGGGDSPMFYKRREN